MITSGLVSDHTNTSVGSVRSIDENGRIVVPADLRKRAGLDAGTLVDFRFVGDSIVMTKIRAECVLCDGTERLTEWHGKDVCDSCLREIRERADVVDSTLQQMAGGIPAAEGSSRLLRTPRREAAAAPTPVMQHAR